MAVFVENLLMTKKKRIQASCSLTVRAGEILARYRNSFGVKHTLSVGLELFDALDATEQIARTTEAGARDKAAREILKRGGSLDEAIRGASVLRAVSARSASHSETPKSQTRGSQQSQPKQGRQKAS